MTASVITSSLLFSWHWTLSIFTKKELVRKKILKKLKLFKERLGNTCTQFLNQLGKILLQSLRQIDTYSVISDHKEKLRRANVLHFFTNASPGQLGFCRGQKNRSLVSLQC
jgi:hypothetical protein